MPKDMITEAKGLRLNQMMQAWEGALKKRSKQAAMLSLAVPLAACGGDDLTLEELQALLDQAQQGGLDLDGENAPNTNTDTSTSTTTNTDSTNNTSTSTESSNSNSNDNATNVTINIDAGSFGGDNHEGFIAYTQTLISLIESLDEQNDLMADQNDLLDEQNDLLQDQIDAANAQNLALLAQLESLAESIGIDLGDIASSIDDLTTSIGDLQSALVDGLQALGEAVATQIADVASSIDDMSLAQQERLDDLLEVLAQISGTLDDNSQIRRGALENDPEDDTDNGDIFLLSMNQDSYNGSENDDLFLGRAGSDYDNQIYTAEAADFLDGRGGRDTLKLSLYESDDEEGLLPTTINIEVLELTSNYSEDWDVSGMRDLEEIRFVNMRGDSSRDTDLYGINNLVDITLSNMHQDVELHFVVGAAAGDEDEITLTLDRVDRTYGYENTYDADIEIRLGHPEEVIETVNLVSIGSMINDLNLVSDGDDGFVSQAHFDRVNISGTAQLNATDDLEDYMSDDGIIDARGTDENPGLQAEMVIRFGEGRDDDEDLTLYTGHMDDLIIVDSSFDSNLDIHTGGGVDTIVLANFDFDREFGGGEDVDLDVYVGAQQTIIQFGYNGEDEASGEALFENIFEYGLDGFGSFNNAGEDSADVTLFFGSDLYDEVVADEDGLNYGTGDANDIAKPLVILGNDMFALAESAYGGLAFDFDDFGGTTFDTREDGADIVEINTADGGPGSDVNLDDDHMYIFSSGSEDPDGTGLVLGAINNFGDLDEVASFLNTYIDDVGSSEDALFLINAGDGTAGGDDYGSSNTVHLYHFKSSGNDGDIDADELIYVATITETYGSSARIGDEDLVPNLA